MSTSIQKQRNGDPLLPSQQSSWKSENSFCFCFIIFYLLLTRPVSNLQSPGRGNLPQCDRKKLTTSHSVMRSHPLHVNTAAYSSSARILVRPRFNLSKKP